MDSKNNSRIAKNTLMLYIRMLLTMGVSLYTVRVVLNTLGVEDYGIYNVVGGIVSSLGFFSSTMAAASQRFFAYEIGRGDMVQLKKTFSMTLLIYCLIALLILLLAETVGLWFLNHKVVLYPGRKEAANCVYQFSILSFMLTMFQVPYDAIVIARERMNVYAYLSILEVFLKLLTVYLLAILPIDNLKAYSILTFLVTLIITSIYRTYCLRNFDESRFKYYWNSGLFIKITSYSGWNLFGALSGMLNSHGITILLNLFFGPAVNAARGIAYQISTAINGFVQNFMTAARPQITKYYSQGENHQMLKLVFQTSKVSFFLLYIISLPFLLQMEYVFSVWLNKVPEHVVSFTRIIIITSLIESLSYPLMATAQATGKIKKYQTVIGGCLLLNLPIAYLFVKFGFSPETVLIIVLTNSAICLFLRLIILKKMVGLPIRSFIYNVLSPVIVSGLIAIILPFLVQYYCGQNCFLQFLLVCFTSVISSLLCSYFIGLTNNERMKLNMSVFQFLNKVKQ